MKEAFIERSFSAQNEAMIALINQILSIYNAQGFRLSLRQLYYQLVARGHIPNDQRTYKNIGNLVSNARQAGRIDWYMIEDRGRDTMRRGHWDSPAQIVEAAARQFTIDKWDDQPYHIEVMVEKDALSGVLEPICHELDIAITANKGYSSSSTMYDIGKRLYREHTINRKKITVIYLGDHDPSGIDMTRDVQERLAMYSRLDCIEVIRLALNWNQIELWRPPENPAKETDARFEGYAKKFGTKSWELDAVEPAQMATIIRQAVETRRDDRKWAAALARETDMKAELQAFVDDYNTKDE
jgi:hypothetical protein